MDLLDFVRVLIECENFDREEKIAVGKNEG
jgi:hypothetical protein